MCISFESNIVTQYFLISFFNDVIPQGQERVQQIQDKITRKQRINSEEVAIMAEWNKQLDRAKELDDEKKAQAYQRELDSRSQLQEQVLLYFEN